MSAPHRRDTRHAGAAWPLVRLALLLVALPVLLCTLSRPVAAQVPPTPPDTMRTDTLRADTVPALPGDTVPADTLRPAVLFPAMPLAPAVQAGGGVWIWTREALLREAPASLTDLLARIPGVTAVRGGMFVQPEAASSLGMTAGQLEIEVDGFVLDPLAASTFDLAQLPLGQIRELRVERRLGLLRVRIFSDAPEEPQPYSRVEAGIGVPPANLFRGLFMAPHVIVGPLGVAVERIDTDGTGRNQPANLFSTWGKWAWTNGGRGVQLEFWRGALRREPDSPWEVDRVRQDLIVRARNAFAPGLVGEVYAGRSALEEEGVEVPGDTIPPVSLERRAYQAGVRAAWQVEHATVSGAVRYRDGDHLPRGEALLRADAGLAGVRLGGEVRYASWPGRAATTHYAADAQLGIIGGLSVFGEATGGQRGAPDYPRAGADTALAVPGSFATERTGWRAGVAAALGARVTASVAAVGFNQDFSRPFGLPFDTAGAPLPAEAVTGVEAMGRLVLLPGWFAVEGAITELRSVQNWLYLPPRSWRAALELHALPLPSGNLELLGRVEGAFRGGMLAWAPGLVEDEPVQTLVSLPGVTRVDAYLQIRIIDVRAFIRWDQIMPREPFEELPGVMQRGPRIFYGVKWILRN